MSLACSCPTKRPAPLHVALALRAAASAALPMLWDMVTRTFSTEACALRFEAGRVLALMPVTSSSTDVPVATRIEQWHQRVSLQLGPISVGRSATHAGPEGIQQAHEEALRALALGERLRGPGFVTAYGEVFALDYAERLIADDRLGGVYEQVLSRLGAFDQAERADLVPTLDAFLASGCSPQRTASAMGIHRNTVLYRLKRMEELADLNLTDTEARFYIQLALRAHRSFADGRGAPPSRRRAASTGA
jgi:DNA-binding PucR family transcriptional regulator